MGTTSKGEVPRKTALFLHMGPGLHAEVERKFYAADFPEIDFWDQPNAEIQGAEKPFHELARRAIQRAGELFAANDSKPIDLIAHSFGGRIALEVLRAKPEWIRSLSCISTGLDLFAGFWKLARILSEDSNTELELREKLKEFLGQNPSPKSEAEFWSLFQLVASDPTFMRLYWPNPEEGAGYFSALAASSPILGEVLAAVFHDVFSAGVGPSVSYSGPVRVLLGNSDPILDLAKETKLWNTVFHNPEMIVLDGVGHFGHFQKKLKRLPVGYGVEE